MPGVTPIAHVQSNKQLLPVELVAPGGYGLNTEQSGSILDSMWATDTLNCVIDTNSRLAARQGTQSVTSTPLTRTSATITNITTAGEAVVTVSTVSTANTFFLGQLLTFSGVVGMVQINGLVGTVLALGGVSGAWTATVNIDTVGMGAYASGGAVSGPLTIESLFEYNGGASVGYQNIVAWAGGGVGAGTAGGISNNFANPAGNLISVGLPNAAFNPARWFFQNFNNKVIGFQAGKTPIVYTGAGNFAPITASSGSIPTGGIGCTAFGRVWTVQTDLQTIQYSGLLDETNWGTTDSGVVDMHTVWSAGTDTVQAIFAFNSSLVICGLNQIVLYTDGRGSLLGIDPTQMYVYDIITGTGCISQFTVQPIGQSDVLFLSSIGVQSLSRLTTNDNNPLITLTKYIRTVLIAQIAEEVPINISSTYNRLQGFYLVSLPVSGFVWCIDLRHPFQDADGDMCNRCTYWAMPVTAMMTTRTNQTYLANQIALPGQVGLYSGSTDGINTYSFNWQSPWLLFPSTYLSPQLTEKLKMLKRIAVILISAGGANVNLSWNVDFASTFFGTETLVLASAGAPSQYGIGQYGLSQYGGGQITSISRADARARGQYYQFALSTVVNGVMALQQFQVAFKIGRIA